MSLKYQPKIKSMLMCTFNDGKCHVSPEMNKTRPVVVVAINPDNYKLVTVVPLSTTEPVPVQAYHCQVTNPVEVQPKEKMSWAKCDTLTTVSIDRLSAYKCRDSKGRTQRKIFRVEDEEFLAIKKCIANILNIPD